MERLTEVVIPDAPTQDETYTLDPEGNRLSSHLSGTGETDVANRLTGDDAYSYVYDLNGNLISKTAKPGVTRPDWSYDYDDLDQLISVSRDGVEVERYRYDAFGRRSVIDTEDGAGAFTRTALINDGSDRTIDLVLGADGVTAQIQNRYTHGGQVDEPLSLEVFTSDGALDQSYTYHADHLGSIRFVTDSVGTIVNAYEYDSYGRPRFELEQVSQPFRYTGREWDQATELYHYRARQYDPETGKFLQEDPIGMTIGLFDNMSNLETSFSNGIISQSRSVENLGGLKHYNLNLYKYVENNPLLYTDYSGQIAFLSYIKTAKHGVENAAWTLAHTVGRKKAVGRLVRRQLNKSKIGQQVIKYGKDKNVGGRNGKLEECLAGILDASLEPAKGVDVDRSSTTSALCGALALFLGLSAAEAADWLLN